MELGIKKLGSKELKYKVENNCIYFINYILSLGKNV